MIAKQLASRRTWLLAILIGAVALLALALPARAQDYPNPVGYVNDFAGVFDQSTASELENALRLVEEETTVEIAVVVVTDLQGVDINTYSVELFEKWQIGQRGENNGVLFITSINDRETRIEVGYGLEPYITDSRAGRILDEAVLPYFTSDQWAQGIIEGAYALRLAFDETGYTAGAPPPEEEFGTDFGFLQPLADRVWALVVVGVISTYLFSFMARTKSVWFGGIWGVGVGALLGWMLGGWGWIAGGAFGLGFVGLALDAVLSSSYKYSSSSGKSTSWGRSWGGFGGTGGGMRSGGGFGGFGGGRSGGGGAGRRF